MQILFYYGHLRSYFSFVFSFSSSTLFSRGMRGTSFFFLSFQANVFVPSPSLKLPVFGWFSFQLFGDILGQFVFSGSYIGLVFIIFSASPEDIFRSDSDDGQLFGNETFSVFRAHIIFILPSRCQSIRLYLFQDVTLFPFTSRNAIARKVPHWERAFWWSRFWQLSMPGFLVYSNAGTLTVTPDSISFDDIATLRLCRLQCDLFEFHVCHSIRRSPSGRSSWSGSFSSTYSSVVVLSAASLRLRNDWARYDSSCHAATSEFSERIFFRDQRIDTKDFFRRL